MKILWGTVPDLHEYYVLFTGCQSTYSGCPGCIKEMCWYSKAFDKVILSPGRSYDLRFYISKWVLI